MMLIRLLSGALYDQSLFEGLSGAFCLEAGLFKISVGVFKINTRPTF